MTGFIDRLYPSSKAAMVLLAIIVGIFTPGYLLQYAMFPVFLLLAIMAGNGMRFFKAFLSSVGTVVLVIFLVQVFIVRYPDSAHIWAFIALSPTGLDKSLGITSRIVSSASAIMWYFQVTTPKDMVYAMEQAHLPKKVTFVIMSTIGMVPQVINRSRTIMDAQKSRGIETEGNAWARVKSFVPMLGPLIFSLIQQTEEHALALQSRAFLAPVPKTSLYRLDKHTIDRVIQVICLLLLILFIIWRVWK